MMFDPPQSSWSPTSEEGHEAGGDREVSLGRRPGPDAPEPPPDMSGFKMTTIREGFGDAHFFVGPLIIAVILFVVGYLIAAWWFTS
jgi:hypothetical protein